MATDKKNPPPGGTAAKPGVRPLPHARPPDKQLTIDKSLGSKHSKPTRPKKK